MSLKNGYYWAQQKGSNEWEPIQLLDGDVFRYGIDVVYLETEFEIAEPLPRGDQHCTLCYDTGWVLEAKIRTVHRSGSEVEVTTLEIMPCPIPDCKASGSRIELMSVDNLGMKQIAVHPKTGILASIFNNKY